MTNKNNNSQISKNNAENQKQYFNYESTTIIGNIGSDILLKTKNKERLEFSVAVNKFNKQTKETTAKWFKIIVFEDELIVNIKTSPIFYKKGTNIKVRGEIQATIHNNKPIFQIIAKQISLNPKEKSHLAKLAE